MDIKFRQETPQDYKAVEKVIIAAFQNMEESDQSEHRLVNRLRNSEAFIPALSIVATFKNEIVGHILLTKIKITNGTSAVESLALAPVSVKPDYQNKGIGGPLIREAHHVAKKIGFQSVILLGHEKYYPRFGYLKANDFGISLPFEVPEENCMAIELIKNSLQKVSGIVEYPQAFFE